MDELIKELEDLLADMQIARQEHNLSDADELFAMAFQACATAHNNQRVEHLATAIFNTWNGVGLAEQDREADEALDAYFEGQDDGNYSAEYERNY